MSSRALRILLIEGLLLVGCTKSPPKLHVTDAWIRPSLDNGAAFMLINNTGGRADHLIGVDCACAMTSSLHETRMDGDVVRTEGRDGTSAGTTQ